MTEPLAFNRYRCEIAVNRYGAGREVAVSLDAVEVPVTPPPAPAPAIRTATGRTTRRVRRYVTCAPRRGG